MAVVSRDEWARSYAKQAKSDFHLYKELLQYNNEIEICHKLHYLQMTCEKIAKAYQLKTTQIKLQDVLTKHRIVSGFINNFLKSPPINQHYHGRTEYLKFISHSINAWAREIEKMAPAIDRENYPINSEYPWEQYDQLVIPCEYAYSNISSLFDESKQNISKEFYRMITTAINEILE